jgi:hypothetical protein
MQDAEQAGGGRELGRNYLWILRESTLSLELTGESTTSFMVDSMPDKNVDESNLRT